MPALRAALRDPLVLFLVLGVGLLGLHAAFRHAPPEGAPERAIVVTQADITALVEAFRRVRMREPTEAEVGELLRQRVREEMLYREALALGLDREDSVTRRRLAQQVEYLARDVGEAIEPTSEDLAAFYEAERERYAEGPWRAFVQVHLSPDRRGEDVRADAEALLARLRRNAMLDPASVGDPSLVEAHHPLSTEDDVARTFGPGFAEAVFALPTGTWQGPIVSGVGVHLVRVDEVRPAATPSLDAVLGRVRADWAAARRDEALAAYLEGLERKYPVSLEAAPAAPDAGAR